MDIQPMFFYGEVGENSETQPYSQCAGSHYSPNKQKLGVLSADALPGLYCRHPHACLEGYFPSVWSLPS